MASAKATFNSAHSCRIVVVDDHAIMRDGLCAMLGNEPDLEVVGVADNGRTAIDKAGEYQPDLLVMDLTMPRTDGAQAIRIIKSKYPEIRVVVLTYHKEDTHIHAALEAGADAYVLKDDGRGELLTAVRNVRAGRSYLSPAICERVMMGYVQGGAPGAAKETNSWEVLTARERQVLKLVAEGYKTREIAEYLSLSKKTVEKHRTNMMRKLDLHGVSAVTAYAIENGLVS